MKRAKTDRNITAATGASRSPLEVRSIVERIQASTGQNNLREFFRSTLAGPYEGSCKMPACLMNRERSMLGERRAHTRFAINQVGRIRNRRRIGFS